jgi:long-chain acyl-CoA synthetase
MDGQTAPRSAPVFNFTVATATSILEQAVIKFGPRPAIDFLGRKYNYAEIGRLTNRAAAGLQKLGVKKGVNVGLCLPNCPYYVIMYYAVLKCGGTIVNFNPLYTEREIETQSRDTDVSIMVTMDLALIQDKIGPLAARKIYAHIVVCGMAAALPPLKSILFRLFKANELSKIPAATPYTTFEKLTSGASNPTPVTINPAQDIAVLQFTGGTTGTPKAAMLSHGNITANVAQCLATMPSLDAGEEKILSILPFFHVFAMTAIMNLGLTIGAELLLIPRMDMKMVMATIYRGRPTILPGVPTLFTAVSNAAEKNPQGADLTFIKLCISGGAPISPDVMDRFERISGCKILEGYGLSEASPVVSFNIPGVEKRGSVGPALPGTMLEIRDREDCSILLTQGERGEICLRGPQVMLGYYQRPVETENVFVDGALRTGDVGYLDEDGYLFIVDRIKDLILCGGYNVYPRVIEEAAYQHPAVQDAIAIGVFDKYRGQAPKLFVTLRAGETATSEEILQFLTEHLNKIEIPKSVEIRDSLPKTMVGKLSKKELIAEEAAKA